MKAAIYTRYSTDKQRKASTEDQARNCLVYASKEGFTITSKFIDEEVTGTSRARYAYNEMLKAAEKHEFDVLLVDDLSRLARDSTEQALTLKRLKFLDIRVIGVSEGYDSDAPGEKIHAAVKGLLNELYVDNIRFQTKRGLEGRALQGMSAGGRAYGYESRPVIQNNEVVGHALYINEEQAIVVRRIHQMFADGHSPMSIAAKLNEEAIPAPRGGTWARSAIHGDPNDGSGILNNALYDGRYIWNRSRFIMNPDTGKRTRKANEESLWIITDTPELRIVPSELWNRVKARQQVISEKSKLKKATSGDTARTGAGPKYLLSGLLKCGACGSNYVIVDRSRYGCARHKDRGAAACANSLKVEREQIESTVLHQLKKHLLTPSSLEKLKHSLAAEASKQLENTGDEVQRNAKRIIDVKRQISRLIDSIKAGVDPLILRDELNELQHERDKLELEQTQLNEQAPVASEVIAIALSRYEELIANLENLLLTRVTEARELLKELFGGAIDLLPKQDGTMDAKMAGMTAGLFSLFARTPEIFSERQINVVAGAGFEPTTFGL